MYCADHQQGENDEDFGESVGTSCVFAEDCHDLNKNFDGSWSNINCEGYCVMFCGATRIAAAASAAILALYAM